MHCSFRDDWFSALTDISLIWQNTGKRRMPLCTYYLLLGLNILTYCACEEELPDFQLKTLNHATPAEAITVKSSGSTLEVSNNCSIFANLSHVHPGVCLMSVVVRVANEADLKLPPKGNRNNNRLSTNHSWLKNPICMNMFLSCFPQSSKQTNLSRFQSTYFCIFSKLLRTSYFLSINALHRYQGIFSACTIPVSPRCFYCKTHILCINFCSSKRVCIRREQTENFPTYHKTDTTLLCSVQLKNVSEGRCFKLLSACNLSTAPVSNLTIQCLFRILVDQPNYLNQSTAQLFISTVKKQRPPIRLHSKPLFKEVIRNKRSLHFKSAPLLRRDHLHPVTFKDATDFLVLPGLRLYDKFTIRFALRTTLRDGLVMFNAGPHGVDFIAFEMINGHLHVLFDMGSGWQNIRLTKSEISDMEWHTVELVRIDVEKNYLLSTIDKDSHEETTLKIQVLHGDRSKNFNLADVLYLGGIPEAVFFQWREKVRNRYGYQGCLANFSVNNQPPYDILFMAKNQSILRPVPTNSVISGCIDRPSGVTDCLGVKNTSIVFNNFTGMPYCLNQGTCVQLWTRIKCACEMTSFQGDRCDQTSTTLRFGATHKDLKYSQEDLNDTIPPDARTIGYLRLSYTDKKRNTQNDEFVLGIQTIQHRTHVPAGLHTTERLTTLLFVTNTAQLGDYLHVYLNSGYLIVDYDLGGGVVRVLGPKLQLNDGFYHRIRGFREQFRLVLEVDNQTNVYHLQGRFGRQFNDQETIWLGHAPNLNKTDFYQGYITGAYYNGLLLNDLAAGLAYRPFIHVTRYGNIKFVPEFEASFASNSPFRKLIRESKYQNKTNSLQSVFAADSAEYRFMDESKRTDIEVKQPPLTGVHEAFEGIGVQHAEAPDIEKVENDKAAIHSQVNIWLLVSLSGAGCIVLCSLTFLAYRLHFKRGNCLHSTTEKGSPLPKHRTKLERNIPQRQQVETCLGLTSVNTFPTHSAHSRATVLHVNRSTYASLTHPMKALSISSNGLGPMAGTSVNLKINPVLVSQSPSKPTIPPSTMFRCPMHSTFSNPVVIVEPNYLEDDPGPWSPQSDILALKNHSFSAQSPSITNPMINSSSFQLIVNPAQIGQYLDSSQPYKIMKSKLIEDFKDNNLHA